MQSSRPYADGVFIGNRTAVVLRSSSDWSEPAVRAALPGEVLARASGRWLVLSTDQALLNTVAGRLNSQPVSQGAFYAAVYQHARELTPYTNLTRMIEHSPQPQMTEAQSEREPEYFSENIASLGRVLQRIQTASVYVRDSGAQRSEQVVYKFQP